MRYIRSGSFALLWAVILLSPLTAFATIGKMPFLSEMQIPDTCGTDYGQKLASCTPFQCQRPHPLFAGNLPSEADLHKMPVKEKQAIETYLTNVEKKLAAMTPTERMAKKTKMTVTFEIKGLNSQGLCQTLTSMTARSRQDCALDETTRHKIAEFDQLTATADSLKSKSTSELVDGKMVTKTLVTVDGKAMVNPWQQALNSGQCKVLHQNSDGAWTPTRLDVQQSSQTNKEITPTNTLFILDASGSMWGQIKGQPKITIAKEVMAKLVPELPENSRIGLLAYGHRRKGDCNDVETLVRLGSGNKTAILTAVKGLNAKGKTPLTRSVNQAFKMLQNQKGQSTIILVSDGIESCAGDPCATVKAARKYGLKFILHTIGFGLTKDKSDQLQCMATAGGGQYFAANNAQELLESTRKAVQPGGLLLVTALVNGKAANVMLRIVDPISHKVIYENILPTASGQKTLLPEGTYNVYVRPGGVSGVKEKALTGVHIKTGEQVEKTLRFDKGTLKLTVTIDGKPVHALVHVEDPTTHKWIYESSVFGTDTPVTISLPAGQVDIEVRAQDQPPERLEAVAIVADKTTEKTIPIIDQTAQLVTKGMEPNTNRWGMDYRDLTLDAANPALCQQICQKEVQCKSWTYVKQGQHCWLKSGIAPAAKDSCCISGLKPDPLLQEN